ncbi:variable surface protein [Plasmodium gonderi]|uniref:Variable surface protein n=1 Tax=Plasmodium gonderi TaxID=77519 RepID=A0A1Y1JQ13_PLAGO|nr:variable surface protein [Plasmodium gonderi]GAW84300.1 variable surface protein [Plasmodium gonderi]
MNMKIYEVVKLFPKCKKLMDDCEYDSYPAKKNLCEKISNNILKPRDPKVLIICGQAMEFLSKLVSYSHNILMEAGCKYLYYWIYYKLKSNNNNMYTNSLYHQVTQVYGEVLIGKKFCDKYKDEINDEQMFKLSFLNELYKCHNAKITIRENNTDEVICKTLNDILDEYKTKFVELVAAKETTENVKSSLVSVPTYQNNIKAAIITTIIFASNSSYFQQKIQRMRNKWENIYSVWSILKQLEINRNISRNNRYNVSYNFY